MCRTTAPLSRRIALGTAVVGAVALLPAGGAPAAGAAPRRPATGSTRRRAEFGVPESVLLAISYLESRWDTNADTPSSRSATGSCTPTTYACSLSPIDAPR